MLTKHEKDRVLVYTLLLLGKVVPVTTVLPVFFFFLEGYVLKVSVTWHLCMLIIMCVEYELHIWLFSLFPCVEILCTVSIVLS